MAVFPWDEEEFSFVKAEHEVMCSFPNGDVCETLCASCNVGIGGWGKRGTTGCVLDSSGKIIHVMWLQSLVLAHYLVDSENRSGPSTEPWGRPISRKQGLDKEPFHVTWKERFVRYDLNHVRAEAALVMTKNETDAKFSREEDLVVDCVKCRRVERGSGATEGLSHSEEGRLSGVSSSEAWLIGVKEVGFFKDRRAVGCRRHVPGF